MKVKTNLPVIFLRDIAILPHNDIRVEFVLELDKLICDLAEMYHDNYLLLVNLSDPLEQNLNIEDLPNIAIVGRIKSKIVLPGGALRLVITGISRVKVLNYIRNEDNTYQAFVGDDEQIVYDQLEANVLKKIVLRDLKTYIAMAQYMSNSVMGRISQITSIGMLTDIVVFELPIDYKEKIKYIKMLNPIERATMILSDINREIENVQLENDIEEKLKHQMDQTGREFMLKEKIKIIKAELGEVDIRENDILRMKEMVKSLHAPDRIMTRLKDEISKYELSLPISGETGIIRNYIEWLLNLPWNYATDDVSDITQIKDELNKNHFGLCEVKERIMEYIMVKQYTYNQKSPIICLVGPPGTGKTTIAKSIATALNKRFVKISVGGVNDEAEIMGHRRTYIGANPGKIIQGLKKAKSNNPIFLIDEIDKMTKDYRGDPASALLDVLDKEQNNIFCDNYIEEEFDLSNVMFILTANSIETIPVALRDRLEIIEFSSYTTYEKIDICKQHLIPKILQDHNLDNKVEFTDQAILKIIKNYTKEAGARELERLIASICRKIVIKSITDDSSNYKVDVTNLEEYLGKIKYDDNFNDYGNQSGVVNALAYTNYGGDILKVSVVFYKGTGKFQTTGLLGDVMKESVKIAFSYIKSNCDIFKIDYNIFEKNDFHIHFEEGAIPKDGPSAGITITTAIISALTNYQIKSNISMTGEMTLRGQILPVGGIKEKLIAAMINGIKEVYISSHNKKDVAEIKSILKNKLNIKYVDNYHEMYKALFLN